MQKLRKRLEDLEEQCGVILSKAKEAEVGKSDMHKTGLKKLLAKAVLYYMLGECVKLLIFLVNENFM